MKWWVFILLPFHLLAQETYNNCVDIPAQTYQVSYDANKIYHWYILGPETNGFYAPVSTNGNTLSIYWPNLIGTYTIAVYTTRFGCEGDTSYYEVIIKDCPYTQLFIPNSFTPNGDNHNDFFFVHGQDKDEVIYFVIFNRWGQRIYEVYNNTPWDGEGHQIGTYTYLIKILNKHFTGTVDLIR